ncbi:hypothetical protein H5V45_18785 [Nocardioides sp. KIGAM211]|uniref:Uncharacterized protein n=1 Tax=Nocardioides luti TaxID=2761101 RepID=A0A7X0RJN1_9ACTN|nr:hypothetical protein [Nocardioides luti]MBB6629380.1 hypothetical protein [Nocardioides luti]
MNDLETRLRDALATTAEERDVDVALLHRATRARIRERGLTPGGGLPDRRSRLLHGPVLVAAAAGVAVAVTAGALLWPALNQDADVAGPDHSRRAVDTTFLCPQQVAVAFDGSQDEFVPDLQRLRGPAGVAREYGAGTFAFDESGDRATLRLGNEDGTLGSVTTYVRSDDGWALRSAEVCTGFGNTADAPTAESLRLGEHGVTPYPSVRLLTPGDRGRASVLLDDRPVYDYSGLVRDHRSIYVGPCEDRLCWATGTPDGIVSSRMPGRPVLRDMTGVLHLPDDMVGRVSTLRLWAVYDPDRTVDSLTLRLQDGSVREGRTVTDPTWDGAVLRVVLGPVDGVDRVVVRSTDGTEVAERPEDVVGYDPRTSG